MRPSDSKKVNVESVKASASKAILISSGSATAIFQSIGFSQWIFSVPLLANEYVRPDTSYVIKQQIEMMYMMLNTYFGMTIGEHLGFIAMALWTLSIAMIVPFHPLYKWLGSAIALLLFVSLAENFGGSYAPFFGQLNFIVNSLWLVWLMAVSIKFL